MINYCEHCHKTLSTGAKNLCLKCYQTRAQWRGHKKIICKNCGKLKKQNAKGLCLTCYSKVYMKDYHAEYERNRRKEQADHINALDRQRNQKPARKEQRQSYQQEYYRKHKDELLKYQSDYRRANPERRDNYKRRSIARRKGLSDTLTLEQWEKILKEHQYACHYCGKKGVKLEKEHRVPAIRGGGFTSENIVPACAKCNRRKRTMTEEEFRKHLEKFPD